MKVVIIARIGVFTAVSTKIKSAGMLYRADWKTVISV